MAGARSCGRCCFDNNCHHPIQQTPIQTKRPERYLTLRIDEIPINGSDTSDKALDLLRHELKEMFAKDPDLRDSVCSISLASRDSSCACATVTFHTSIPETELIGRLQRVESRTYQYDFNFHGITPLYGDSDHTDVE